MAAGGGGAGVVGADVKGLEDADAWMTAEERRLVGVLLEAHQEHLFVDWVAGQDTESKHSFFEQVRGGEGRAVAVAA
jgi:hypothetical protein